MSKSTALNPVVTRSGGSQAIAPNPTRGKSIALQPKVTVAGVQTVTPEPAR